MPTNMLTISSYRQCLQGDPPCHVYERAWPNAMCSCRSKMQIVPAKCRMLCVRRKFNAKPYRSNAVSEPKTHSSLHLPTQCTARVVNDTVPSICKPRRNHASKDASHRPGKACRKTRTPCVFYTPFCSVKVTVIMQQRRSEVKRPNEVCKPILRSKEVPSFLVNNLFPVP